MPRLSVHLTAEEMEKGYPLRMDFNGAAADLCHDVEDHSRQKLHNPGAETLEDSGRASDSDGAMDIRP